MNKRIINEAGKVYGLLLVGNRYRKNSYGAIEWFCRCACGNICYVQGAQLRKGNTTSCGCVQERRFSSIRSENNLFFNGELLNMNQWAKRTGIKRSTIQYRINVLGWTVRDALMTKVNKDFCNHKYR